MLCPKCQMEIQEDSKFCPFCGAEITVSAEAPVPEAEEVSGAAEPEAQETVTREAADATENTVPEPQGEKAGRNRKKVAVIGAVIGVAVIVRMSRLARICFRRCLSATPKRCSSSMMRSPKLANCTSLESKRCVPMTISTSPRAVRAKTSDCSACVRKRLNISMVMGNPDMRSMND